MKDLCACVCVIDNSLSLIRSVCVSLVQTVFFFVKTKKKRTNKTRSQKRFESSMGKKQKPNQTQEQRLMIMMMIKKTMKIRPQKENLGKKISFCFFFFISSHQQQNDGQIE